MYYCVSGAATHRILGGRMFGVENPNRNVANGKGRRSQSICGNDGHKGRVRQKNIEFFDDQENEFSQRFENSAKTSE